MRIFFLSCSSYHYQRDQGGKLRLEISRIFIDRDSNIIDRHKSAILPYEVSNKVSRPGLHTDSKPNLDRTQCAKYLFNYQLNLNPSIPSSNFSCKYYSTHTQPYQRIVMRVSPV